MMNVRMHLAILICLSCSLSAWAQSAAELAPSVPQQNRKLFITVTDENGLPVVSARAVLSKRTTGATGATGATEAIGATQTDLQADIQGETDYAGRREFMGLEPGIYTLRVEKEGFYAVLLKEIKVGETESLEITLNREQELREAIDVIYSPPAIDPAKTVSSESLNSREIVNIPYPTGRDLRNVLRFMPGVVQDVTGQLHLHGSATNQILNVLDGFNISHPTNGLLEMRISPDAVREAAVLSSRYSAEYGKGSGGVLNLTTGMGNDRFLFSATDFIPSFQIRKGVNLNGWTPRATVSGPLSKKRAWFFNAFDGDFNLDIINGLPSGADRNHAWRGNDLAKAQVNLSQAHILTGSFLINRFYVDHAGISQFNPEPTTRSLRQSGYLFTLKSQSYLSNGLSLELGFGLNQFRTVERPQGNSPFTVFPEGTSGNFFKTADGMSRRLQWIANLILPPVQWRGRHEFKLGIDLDRVTHDQLTERRPVYIRRADNTLARDITYVNVPRFGRTNFEVSGFAQDRWTVSDRFLVELGLRLDWDQIIHETLVSPRLASTYLLTGDGETKLSFGLGLFYGRTNLSFITRPLAGQRFDQFYASDGATPRGDPVETVFRVNEGSLTAPRSFNFSAGLERKLPASIYLRLEFMEKHGTDGFTFLNGTAFTTDPPQFLFELANQQDDRYRSVTITLRRTFKESYTVFAAYTRSMARSNAVFDFSLDNILFSPQAGGPLPWDAPNRFISWGWIPLVKKFDLAWALEWRDGFPFSLLNGDQHLVGSPNTSRFPAYFALNLHAERRFRLLNINWAVRAGFNNITNNSNPSEVNNNVDSHRFLTYGGVQSRVFVGRIRFLGRK